MVTEPGYVRCSERFPVTHDGRGLRCLKAAGHSGQHGGPGLVNWSTEEDEDESGSSA